MGARMKAANRIKAIVEYNKMDGVYTPEKQELSGTLELVNIKEMPDEQLIEFARKCGVKIPEAGDLGDKD